jgi:hypothetical protein
VTDVVDVLRTQHDQMRRLCGDVQRAAGADKKRLFAELDLLVNLHELGDRTIIHPAVRDSTPAGDAIGVARMVEEGNIERALAELHALGVDDVTFDTKFAAVHAAILDHDAHEEREEFPLLRLYVKPQRLHMMVGQLHDVQVMGVG